MLTKKIMTFSEFAAEGSLADTYKINGIQYKAYQEIVTSPVKAFIRAIELVAQEKLVQTVLSDVRGIIENTSIPVQFFLPMYEEIFDSGPSEKFDVQKIEEHLNYYSKLYANSNKRNMRYPIHKIQLGNTKQLLVNTKFCKADLIEITLELIHYADQQLKMGTNESFARLVKLDIEPIRTI